MWIEDHPYFQRSENCGCRLQLIMSIVAHYLIGRLIVPENNQKQTSSNTYLIEVFPCVESGVASLVQQGWPCLWLHMLLPVRTAAATTHRVI